MIVDPDVMKKTKIMIELSKDFLKRCVENG